MHLKYSHMPSISKSLTLTNLYTVELQWLKHILNHENKFETGVVRASEG